MKDTIIVSCCYSPGNGRSAYYGGYADRLERSLDKYAPGVDRHIWRDAWPPGSPPHSQQHYAFKWYAIEAARAHHRYVLWMDAGCEAVAMLDLMLERIRSDGYLFLEGDDNLGEWISDEALRVLATDRSEAYEMKLFGGCLLGFDFQNEKAKSFFAWYEKLAKTRNLFMCSHRGDSKVNGIMKSVQVSDGDGSMISVDPRVKGHRSDEACFSIVAKRLGMTPMKLAEWYRYGRTY